MSDVTKWRAEFVYEAARLQALAVSAPVVPEPWAARDEKFRAQFLEVIERQMGPMRSGSPAELSWRLGAGVHRHGLVLRPRARH